MEPGKMLDNMFETGLTAQERNALCRSRGFSQREISTPNLFKNVFLSDRGLQAAFASLERDEIAALHIMKFGEKVVDVTFFQYLYGTKGNTDPLYSKSFTSSYGDVLKNVRKSLVRKGVLVFAEKEGSRKSTCKMERLRFGFPVEFEEFLPGPFREPMIFDDRGAIRENNVFRGKLISGISGGKSRIPGESTSYDIGMVDGKIIVGGREFRTGQVWAWSMQSWKNTAKVSPGGTKRRWVQIRPSFIDVAVYAFSLLRPGEWILPEELTVFWRVLFPDGKYPENTMICEEGVRWGCLSKYEIKGRSYYRLSKEMDVLRPGTGNRLDDADPGSYLISTGSEHVMIDLTTVPYDSLEILSRISKLKARGSTLSMTPDLIRIGSSPDSIRKHPLIQWLRERSPLFRDTMRIVENRRGKLLVHKNLLIAQVKDLSLLVRIRRAFPATQIQVLSNDHIAFPHDILPEMENLLMKSGHVIKKVCGKNEKSRNRERAVPDGAIHPRNGYGSERGG